MYVVMVIGFINVELYFKKGLLLFLQTSLRFESFFFFLEKSIFLSCKDGELFCFMTFFNQVTWGGEWIASECAYKVKVHRRRREGIILFVS